MSVTSPRGRGERVLVVAKAPQPGRTKTRLCPPLSADEASALGRAMLLDTLEACRRECDDVGLLHADPMEAEALRALAGPHTPLVLQRGAGLAGALRSGADAALASADAAALVASDVPGISPGSLRRAFAELRGGADVVLGPGFDGGYWLVALREPHAAPFEGIPWSTPEVLTATLERCAAAGLSVSLLEPWRDVDTAADLAALLPGVDRLPGRRTAELVRRLAAASEPPSSIACSSSYERSELHPLPNPSERQEVRTP